MPEATHDYKTIGRIHDLERKTADLKCADNIAIMGRDRIHKRLSMLEATVTDLKVQCAILTTYAGVAQGENDLKLKTLDERVTRLDQVDAVGFRDLHLRIEALERLNE